MARYPPPARTLLDALLMRRRNALLWATLALLAFGCGSSSEASSLRGESAAPDDAAGSSGGPGAGAAAPSEPPPEKEVESDYEAPVATGHFVWVANPRSGRVAFVDAITLQVRTVEAGNAPTFLASVPGQAEDTTLVLNVLSNDATLLRASSGGITAKTMKIAPLANSLAFSSDGRFAIAWCDSRKVPSAPRAQGFQDLTVLDLVTGIPTVLAVGYRPVVVGFAAGQPRAYAVTQDGIAIVDLSGEPLVVKNVGGSGLPN